MLARNEGNEDCGMDSVRLVSWNVAGRYEPWGELVKMGVDVALLQETGRILLTLLAGSKWTRTNRGSNISSAFGRRL